MNSCLMCKDIKKGLWPICTFLGGELLNSVTNGARDEHPTLWRGTRTNTPQAIPYTLFYMLVGLSLIITSLRASETHQMLRKSQHFPSPLHPPEGRRFQKRFQAYPSRNPAFFCRLSACCSTNVSKCAQAYNEGPKALGRWK